MRRCSQMPEGPFRSPAGLFLLGGGALGAWQASVLQTLELRQNGAFGSVAGLSAGALNAAAYFLDRLDEAVETWRNVDGGTLKFAPRLRPLSLFSNAPVLELIDGIHDSAGPGRGRLTILSASLSQQRPVYAHFTPQARDGRLKDHLLASCAIPVIFPPMRLDVEGNRLTLVDGGVPTLEPISMDCLGPCQDALILSMVRPDEETRLAFGFFTLFDQGARRTMLRLERQAAASLLARPEPPRVYALHPSRRLDFVMLDFTPKKIAAALELGAADAEAFLKDPERWRLPAAGR